MDAGPWAGNLIVKLVPFPTSLATSIVPPWSETICLAIANPRPLPPVRRSRAGSARQNRSNTWGRCSGAIPAPVSEIVTTASEPDRTARSSTRPPGGVARTALATTLPSTWRSRSGSPWAYVAASAATDRRTPAASATA